MRAATLHGTNLTGRFSFNSDKEVARFMTAYNKVKDQDDRLDAAASLMGWHRDDWSSTDEIELDENDFTGHKTYGYGRN